MQTFDLYTHEIRKVDHLVASTAAAALAIAKTDPAIRRIAGPCPVIGPKTDAEIGGPARLGEHAVNASSARHIGSAMRTGHNIYRNNR
jgi:hypothetical protein